VAEIVSTTDLPSALQENELIDLMVAGANANASRVAPCLAWDGTSDGQPAPSNDQLAEAKLILVGMIQRWAEAGSGALAQQTAGPFGMTIDTRQKSSGFRPWPSEIKDLQSICADPDGDDNKAYSVDTVACSTGPHADWCSLAFGATFCSCGVDIAGEPIFYEDC
jgi:hypothetical protein